MASRDLTQGSVTKNLIFMSIPVMLAMLLQVSFNLTDLFFVGFLGSESLAAVGITFTIIFLFIAFGMGLNIGTTALVSRAIGKNHHEKANEIARHSLILSLIVSVGIALFGFIFSQPLLEFMGARGEILTMALGYTQLIFIGFIFMFFEFFGRSILMAEGDSMTSTKYMLYGGILNVILDPLMIFGLYGFPAMGVTGSALATVISRCIATFLILRYLFSGKTKTKIEFKNKKMDFKIFKEVIMIGIPASLSNVLNSVAFIIIMSFIGVFGTAALAGYSIITRIESIVIMPTIAISTSVTPIIGQNLGAKQFARMRKTVKRALQAMAVIIIPLVLALLLFSDVFMMVFSRETEIIQIGVHYFSIVAVSYLFWVAGLIFISVFNGAGKTGISMALNVFRWICIIGLILFVFGMQTLEGIFYSVAAGQVIFMIACAGVYFSGYWMK